MNPTATNRDALLQITTDTLAAIHREGAETIIATPGAESAEIVSTERDVVANALSAALDYARLEDDLLQTAGRSLAESAQNRPYIPSNQALSLMQSAIDEFLDEQPVGPEAGFDTSDPGWLSVAFEKLKAMLRGKHKFAKHTSADSFRHDLPSDAVVVLFSDWGTGEDTARRVMVEIKKANPSHAIHLGDVYYSGTEKEIRKRFLAIIDELGPSSQACRYFALNSNHEMYSGGHAYFDLMLQRFGQDASYFNLRNQHWQLIGLDTGYEDHGLQDPQADWLSGQLGGQARNILLTHHQLFSPFEKRAFDRKLHEKIQPFLPAIHGWFWGHEHKGIVFGPHLGIKARCIGHGAIPADVPYSERLFPDIPVEHIDERPAPGSNDVTHGFALLAFSGAALEVSYVDEFGETWFTEQF